MNVSIVVPVRNNEEMIGDCIESLLAQDFPKDDYEIIVVDNNSTDKTAETIKRYHVKYLFEEKIGASFARNTGIKNSSGEIVAFTDSDCIADRKWLREIVKGFKKDNAACVGGEILGYTPAKTAVEQFLNTIDYLSQHKRFNERGEQEENGEFPVYSPTGNVAYKRDILVEVEMFDTNINSGEDTDLSWRVQWAGYKIIFERKALIWHKNIRTVTGMFRRFFRVGYTRPFLINKHMKRFNKRIFVKKDRFVSLIKHLCLIIPLLIIGKNKEAKMKPLFLVILDMAMIGGRIYGSIRNRIVYLY